MIMHDDNAFNLPSVQTFVGKMVEALADRRSLVVALPDPMSPPDFWSRLRWTLSQRSFVTQEVLLPELLTTSTTSDAAIVTQFSSSLGVHWAAPDTPRTVENLIEMGGLPDVICLMGIENLTRGNAERWISFVAQWAHSSQSTRNPAPAALYLAASAAYLPVDWRQSNVRLATWDWWGIPSTLEMQLLCRIANENTQWDTKARWRESVLPAIAGNDYGLIRSLWECGNYGQGEITAALREYGCRRRWNETALASWGALDFLDYNTGSNVILSTSRRWRLLWAQGVLQYTPENGAELHSAALVLLGRFEELHQRIWRGQSQLLLPFLDSIRVSVCSYLSRVYGGDWPVKWIPPPDDDREAVRINPLASQWGHLHTLFTHCDELRGERLLRSLVALSRQLRNEIAHCRAVSFSDFHQLCSIRERCISENDKQVISRPDKAYP